jgi:nicotinamidase-related amidase
MSTTTIQIGNSQVGKCKWSLNPNDAVMLLIDHQSGLFQLVKDIDQTELRNNVIALAKAANFSKIPTFTTASVPEGPNGPLIPDIHQSNPDAVYIPRMGQINAWDNPEWVKAIEKTGRKTLVMAGTLTSVCMALPALSAIEAGYKVFCVVDASGNHSRMATDLTIARVSQAGVHPIDTFAVMSEIMATWNREDSWKFARIMMENIVPRYRTVAESANNSQASDNAASTANREKKLDKLSAGIQSPS